MLGMLGSIANGFMQGQQKRSAADWQKEEAEQQRTQWAQQNALAPIQLQAAQANLQNSQTNAAYNQRVQLLQNTPLPVDIANAIDKGDWSFMKTLKPEELDAWGKQIQTLHAQAVNTRANTAANDAAPIPLSLATIQANPADANPAQVPPLMPMLPQGGMPGDVSQVMPQQQPGNVAMPMPSISPTPPMPSSVPPSLASRGASSAMPQPATAPPPWNPMQVVGTLLPKFQPVTITQGSALPNPNTDIVLPGGKHYLHPLPGTTPQEIAHMKLALPLAQQYGNGGAQDAAQNVPPSMPPATRAQPPAAGLPMPANVPASISSLSAAAGANAANVPPSMPTQTQTPQAAAPDAMPNSPIIQPDINNVPQRGVPSAANPMFIEQTVADYFKKYPDATLEEGEAIRARMAPMYPGQRYYVDLKLRGGAVAHVYADEAYKLSGMLENEAKEFVTIGIGDDGQPQQIERGQMASWLEKQGALGQKQLEDATKSAEFTQSLCLKYGLDESPLTTSVIAKNVASGKAISDRDVLAGERFTWQQMDAKIKNALAAGRLNVAQAMLHDTINHRWKDDDLQKKNYLLKNQIDQYMMDHPSGGTSLFTPALPGQQ